MWALSSLANVRATISAPPILSIKLCKMAIFMTCVTVISVDCVYLVVACYYWFVLSPLYHTEISIP